MNDNVDKPRTKMGWLKDVNVLIGIGGVVATIIVGVVTYWLTADSVSREYQERIKAARNDVLISVARSIGEGVVPNRNKVQSVLNSVRRQYNIKEADFETPDTVIDDVLTRVLANEFLDAKRREELSEKLMAVKDAKPAITDEKKSIETKSNRLSSDRFLALFTGLTASMIAAMALLFIVERFKRSALEERNREQRIPRRDRSDVLVRQALVMLVTLVAIVITTWSLFTVTGRDSGIFSILLERPERIRSP